MANKTTDRTTPTPIAAARAIARAAADGFISRAASAIKTVIRPPDSPVLQAQASGKPTPPPYGEQATQALYQRETAAPNQLLTMDRWNAAVSKANNGDPSDQILMAELFEEKDAQVAAGIETIRYALSGHTWAVLAAGETPLDTQAAEFCDKALRSIPNAEEALLLTWDGEYKGVSLLELIWNDETAKPRRILDIVWRHAGRVRFNRNDAKYAVDQPMITSPQNPTNGDPLPYGKYILHTPRTGTWRSRGGLVRRIAEPVIIKRTFIADQAAYIDKFGHPPLMASIQQDSFKDEGLKAAVWASLCNLGHAAIGLIPDSVKYELVQPAPGGDEVFSKACAYQDAQITKALLGHTGSTDAVATGIGGDDDSLAVRQIRLEAYARAIEATWRECVLRPLAEMNFPGAEVPYLHLDVGASDDLLTRVQVDEKLTLMGWQPTQKYITETYGRPIAAPGEAVLTPPTAPVPPGGGGGYPFDGGRATSAVGIQRAAVPLPNQNARGYAEELAAQALSEGLPLWRAYIAPAADAIQSATSFEDLEAKLAKIGLNSDEIADFLHRCKLTGQMIGRLQVTHEVGMSIGDPPDKITPMPPSEAIEWNKKRPVMSDEAFKQTDDKTRTASFTLAGEQDTAIIGAVRDRISAALESGETLKDFQAGYADITGTDIGSAHAETVFRNAIMQSVSAGRWKQQTNPEVVKLRPYLQYRTSGDGSVRPNHAKLDGLVYPADHPFWDTHYPPSGHRCRCTVVSLSERQVKARGLVVQDAVPEGAEPDPGFAANPGEIE